MEPSRRIEVRTLTDKKVGDVPLPSRSRHLDTDRGLIEFKMDIAAVMNLPNPDPNQMRLVYKGEQLQSCRDIDDDNEVVLVLPALSGGARTPESLLMENPYLDERFIEEENMKEDVISSLRDKAKEEGVNIHHTYSYDREPGIFKRRQGSVICNFMDFLSDEIDRGPTTIHWEMGVDQLKLLLSIVDDRVDREYKSANISSKMKRVFQRVEGCRLEWKIVLTTILGPYSDASTIRLSPVDFHCQSMDNTSTSQIALNPVSEYSGGTMYFFVNDELKKIENCPGSLVSHPPKVLCGVSEVTVGQMKFMRVVDKCNNFGGEEIIPVEWEQVMSFVKAQGDESDGDSSIEEMDG